MPMKTNDKVVCVDDSFEAVDHELFSSLPQSGQVYTVRMYRAGSDGVLLLEIAGAWHPDGCEYGFRGSRFRKLESEEVVSSLAFSEIR